MERPVKVGYVETKSVMTKSNAPLGGYSVNPYVGCPHACRYCYASFMKRFTGHTEDWGTFMDVKEWPEITNPKKYAGQKVIIGIHNYNSAFQLKNPCMNWLNIFAQ